VSTTLEHFRCMIGNTTEARSHSSSRSDSWKLRALLRTGPYVWRECGVKKVLTLRICTKDKQRSCHVLQQFLRYLTNSFYESPHEHGPRFVRLWMRMDVLTGLHNSGLAAFKCF
jgi:hypothetical protein